jgi:hypothetical protein
MAPTVTEWKARLKKWDNGIDPAIVDAEVIQDYVDTKLY